MGVEVVVTEKIHGANFQADICVDEEGGCTIAYGSRKGVIAPQNSFFGFRRTIHKYETRLLSLARSLGGRVIVYGEYYGGLLDGVTAPGSVCVQNSPFANYCADNRFVVFDIMVAGAFLPWTEVKRVTLCHGLPVVPELATGVYPAVLEALDIDTLRSTLAEGKQLAEGVVVTSGTRSRVKLVHPKMREKPQPSRRIPYAGYMNQNRVDKYISKTGDVFSVGTAISELVADAMVDVEEDVVLTAKEAKQARGILGGVARRLLEKHGRVVQ